MKQEMEEELVSNILPFWINRMTDEVNGGFYGRITGREEVKPEAEKGAILNARILWTFSAAYRLLKRPEYLETATRAKRTLIDRFYDNEFGGVYWSLDYKGNPLDTKKQIYALGFAIYGLSEYARATGDDGSAGHMPSACSRPSKSIASTREKRLLRSLDPRMGRNSRHAPQRQG